MLRDVPSPGKGQPQAMVWMGHTSAWAPLSGVLMVKICISTEFNKICVRYRLVAGYCFGSRQKLTAVGSPALVCLM